MDTAFGWQTHCSAKKRQMVRSRSSQTQYCGRCQSDGGSTDAAMSMISCSRLQQRNTRPAQDWQQDASIVFGSCQRQYMNRSSHSTCWTTCIPAQRKGDSAGSARGIHGGNHRHAPGKIPADSKEGDQTASGNGEGVNLDLMFSQNNVQIARETRQLQFLYPAYQTFSRTFAKIHRRPGQRRTMGRSAGGGGRRAASTRLPLASDTRVGEVGGSYMANGGQHSLS